RLFNCGPKAEVFELNIESGNGYNLNIYLLFFFSFHFSFLPRFFFHSFSYVNFYIILFRVRRENRREKKEKREERREKRKRITIKVNLGFPIVTLAKQHRMLPEIADLVKYTLYPNLQHGPRVSFLF